MLLNDLEINVFKVDNENFDLIGVLESCSSLIWPREFKDVGTFELWASITPENNELLKAGNVIWIGGKEAGIIEIINPQITREGERKYNIKGRTLECLLDNRILLGTYTKKAKISTILYDLVNKNFINPDDTKRKMPWLECAPDLFLGNEISYQKTGQTIKTNIDKIAENLENIGYRINFDPRNKKLIFEVVQGKNRTIGNTDGNEEIEISTEFDDVLESDYYMSIQEDRNIALVQGELPKDAEGKETGEPRREVTVGDTNLIGFNRKELYVDARDLQSNVNEEGQETQKQIPLNEYLDMLRSRGKDKLAEYSKVEEFKASIRTDGNTQYILDTDYFLGDTISVVDEELNVKANVQVTGITESFSSSYELELTLGFKRPTIIDKLRRMAT